jgi:soluble lytic murein transglycosylase-like protein
MGRVCFKSALIAAWMVQAAVAEQIRSVVRSDARSGKLVRSVVQRPAAIREVANQIARTYDLEPGLVHSVIQVESNYNPYAISPKGALGIMQLVPSTARRFGVANVFNPVQNIDGGVRYLKYLLDLYSGNYRLALAAYNAGEAAVTRYGGIPPYPETRGYVSQVDQKLGEARRATPVVPNRDRAVPVQPAKTHNSIHTVLEPDGKVSYVTR